MSERAAFLDRVRVALADAPQIPDLPPPARRDDETDEAALADRLTSELERAGGRVSRVASEEEAATRMMEILRAEWCAPSGARRAVRAETPFLNKIAPLLQQEVDLIVAGPGSDRETLRAAQFEVDAGICEIDFGVAETGTLAVLTRPGQGRAVSLLPPLHIGVLRAKNIVFELGALLQNVESRGIPPSALTLITGPSKTGDIELILTTGVHGPGELHLIVIS